MNTSWTTIEILKFLITGLIPIIVSVSALFMTRKNYKETIKSNKLAKEANQNAKNALNVSNIERQNFTTSSMRLILIIIDNTVHDLEELYNCFSDDYQRYGVPSIPSNTGSTSLTQMHIINLVGYINDQCKQIKELDVFHFSYTNDTFNKNIKKIYLDCRKSIDNISIFLETDILKNIDHYSAENNSLKYCNPLQIPKKIRITTQKNIKIKIDLLLMLKKHINEQGINSKTFDELYANIYIPK